MLLVANTQAGDVPAIELKWIAEFLHWMRSVNGSQYSGGDVPAMELKCIVDILHRMRGVYWQPTLS